MSASATDSRLRLTLTLARSTYPRNALVQATVQVDNLTDRDVNYALGREQGCPPPAYLYPIVRAVGADGTAYPPALPPGLPTVACLPGAYGNFRPNEQRTYTIPVVLVANHVRVTLLVQNAEETATTPLGAEVAVKLTRGVAPRVSIRAQGSGLIATVHANRAIHGPLYYMDKVSCGAGPDAFLVGYHDAWTAHQGITLRSGHYSPCAPPDHWYLMVGWLNHPIAIIQYRSPAHSPPAPQ